MMGFSKIGSRELKGITDEQSSLQSGLSHSSPCLSPWNPVLPATPAQALESLLMPLCPSLLTSRLSSSTGPTFPVCQEVDAASAWLPLLCTEQPSSLAWITHVSLVTYLYSCSQYRSQKVRLELKPDPVPHSSLNPSGPHFPQAEADSLIDATGTPCTIPHLLSASFIPATRAFVLCQI
jgi:hypothetical protein